MKIVDLKTYLVENPSNRRIREKWLFVKLITDNGIGGIGEVYGVPFNPQVVVQLVQSVADRFVIDTDPFQIETMWRGIYASGYDQHPDLTKMAIISGLETACWDIIGKALDQPIYNLLGGRCREKVRVYVDGFFRGAEYIEEEYAKKAVEAVDQGFTALKMDVDTPIPSGRQLNRSISLAELKHMVKMVGSVRDAVGDEIDLAIDAHGAFDTVTAMKLVDRLEEFDLMWIEDPIPSGNALAMAKVSAASSTPICTGELLNTRYEFRELLENQAADIIMPDIARTGGVLDMKKIAALADTYYIPIAPHNMVGPIATMASAHLCACVPNFLILEFQLGDVEWRDRLLDKPVPVVDGCIELPTEPGIGFELNRKELKKHLVE